MSESGDTTITTTAAAEVLSSVSPEWEYRSESDDAWYAVRLLLQNEVLIIKYVEFSDDCDEKFWAGDSEFSSSLERIEEFRSRFRAISDQVQDSECGSVREGARVCACLVDEEERRFYDAVVDAVKSEKHSFKNGEEECRCTFILSWIHGPKAGALTTAKIENICLVLPSDEMDPRLASFLRISRGKLAGLTSGVGERTPESYSSTFKFKPDNRISEGSGPSPSPRCFFPGNIGCNLMQDLDLGGADESKGTGKQTRGLHVILIENLEKNIMSSTIVNFIGRHTSISADAYVFPSLGFESYTRGALLVNSAEKLQRLQNFLHKKDQIIISSRGRPWVVPDTTKYDSRSASYGFLELNSRRIKAEPGEEDTLKVIFSGSEEYARAELLRSMFMEFSNHQLRLHRRLLYEERRILQPSIF